MPQQTTPAMNKICLLWFLVLVAFLAGYPSLCSATNLRAKSTSSKDATTIADTDLVGISAYLVLQIDGYGMEDLEDLSLAKQAILDCALHKAFDKVHGDRDGLYMSGQQILATDEENDTFEAETSSESGVVLKRPSRPRKFPSKPRPRPRYPPPRLPPREYSNNQKWNMYSHLDTSGYCSMCPDDDSLQGNSQNLLLNKNERLALSNKKNQDQIIASQVVLSEASVNDIADAVRANLIDKSCNVKGNDEDSFEFVRDVDIFVLSKSDFEESVATIMANREAKDVANTHSVANTPNDLTTSLDAPALLPFYYGGYSPSTFAAAATTNRLFRIGLSGVDCGAWVNEDLLDMNSGLHDSINAMGFTDKGHVIDKIVGGRKHPQSERHYTWKCHYDVYAKLDLEGNVLDNAALDDISDAFCDDLIQFGGREKFQKVIDCHLAPVTATQYKAIVDANKNTGLPLSSTYE